MLEILRESCVIISYQLSILREIFLGPKNVHKRQSSKNASVLDSFGLKKDFIHCSGWGGGGINFPVLLSPL